MDDPGALALATFWVRRPCIRRAPALEGRWLRAFDIIDRREPPASTAPDAFSGGKHLGGPPSLDLREQKTR